MTIRNRLTLRFTMLVSSILLLTFVCIYAYCQYFISSDFYRRLDRKAATVGDMFIRHRLEPALLQRLGRIRRDQLPNQRIVVYDGRDSLLFATNTGQAVTVDPSLLAHIRQRGQKDVRQDGYSLSGSRYTTAAGQFVVIASAQNIYGDTFLRQLFWALTGLFGLIIGVTALAGRLFAGEALRPMQHLDQTLGYIYPHNQTKRLSIPAEADEISRLSLTINRLLDRVGESFRLQRLFVANVSHELKNPLTKISSQLEVSLLNERDPTTYRQTIRSVLDDVSGLSALTRELLQLSQVNQERADELLTDGVRLDDVAWDVRQEVSALQPRYQVTVVLGSLPDDPDGLAIRGNQTLLYTALKNLTENACKFADDGHALLRILFEPTGVQLTVENNGSPIPAADLPYLFEPFYRSRQTADQVRGYGVGLSLVERIVQLHGGRIWVESGAGVPTRFHVWLGREPNSLL